MQLVYLSYEASSETGKKLSEFIELKKSTDNVVSDILRDFQYKLEPHYNINNFVFRTGLSGFKPKGPIDLTLWREVRKGCGYYLPNKKKQGAKVIHERLEKLPVVTRKDLELLFNGNNIGGIPEVTYNNKGTIGLMMSVDAVNGYPSDTLIVNRKTYLGIDSRYSKRRRYFKNRDSFFSYITANQPKKIWSDTFSNNKPLVTITEYGRNNLIQSEICDGIIVNETLSDFVNYIYDDSIYIQ